MKILHYSMIAIIIISVCIIGTVIYVKNYVWSSAPDSLWFDFKTDTVYIKHSWTAHTPNVITSKMADVYRKIFIKSPDLRKVELHMMLIFARSVRQRLDGISPGSAEISYHRYADNNLVIDFYNENIEGIIERWPEISFQKLQPIKSVSVIAVDLKIDK